MAELFYLDAADIIDIGFGRVASSEIVDLEAILIAMPAKLVLAPFAIHESATGHPDLHAGTRRGFKAVIKLPHLWAKRFTDLQKEEISAGA